MSVHFGGDAEMVEVVLRTIVSVNQLGVYGAVPDMCDELTWRISGCLRRLVAEDNSETVVMPTDLSTTNETLRTNETLQGNLLHDYKRKFANLPGHFQLIKLCSNAGIVKTAAAGQYFMNIDDAELEKLGGREEGGRGECVHVKSTLYIETTQRNTHVQTEWKWDRVAEDMMLDVSCKTREG